MSERIRVIGYLNKTMNSAWTAGDFEHAMDCHHFLNALEVMTDQEYEECYGEMFAGAVEEE